MGRMLAIGINHAFSVSQSASKKADKTFEEAISIVKERRAPDELYDMCIKEGYNKEQYALFTLKSEVIKQEIVPFLDEFYQLCFGGRNYDRDEILERLKKVETYQDMLDYASEKSCENFQNDEYGDPIWMEVEGTFSHELRCNHEAVIICLEGKILMETYGRIFGLLRRLLAEKLSQYKMAQALDVYITG